VILNKYNDMRRASPDVSADTLWSILEDLYGHAALQAKEARNKRNPQRRAFWAAHPELSEFYSDLTVRELELVKPF